MQVLFWDWAAPLRGIAGATGKALRQRHSAAEQALKAWFEEAPKAAWSQASDIKVRHRGAGILKNRRVVFNIRGDGYRPVVAIASRLQIVYVMFIGTHTRCDAIDAHTIEPS
jgi:mRNA interferase HigB